MEQRELAGNLIITGIDEPCNNTETKKELIQIVAQSIPQIKEQEIQKIFRLGREHPERSRPIKVVTNEAHKMELLQNRKQLIEKKIYVNEELSKYKQEIFNCANKLKFQKIILGAWIYKSDVYI
jgi:hypothetical protein